MITQKNNKGFTLVELIVVITILAILGTIGFISLQGYSGQSRDSKRTSDLRSLSTAITTKSTEGIALTAMPNGTTTPAILTMASATIGGAISTTADYAAGVPNYTVLGLNASNFKDPLGSEYRVGASTRNNGVFQVAAKMEPSGSNTNGAAEVTGNYVARTNVAYTASGTVGSTSITNLPTTAIGLIKKGDTVFTTGLTANAAFVVSSVSGDGRSLILATPLTAGTLTNIQLGTTTTLANWHEPAGLIVSTAGATLPVVDGSGATLPY